MQTSVVEPGPAAPARHGLIVDRRLIGIAVVIEVVAMTLAYVAVNYPLAGPQLTRAEAVRYWPAAAIGALVVAIGACLVVAEALSRRRASAAALRAAPVAQPAGAVARAGALPRVPRSLRFEHVRRSSLRIAAALSLAAIPLSALLGAPFWLAWLAILTPWVPLVTIEARWKYARYGVFSCFAMLGILQLLHLVEHSVQVGQLVATNGDLSRSHGIIGQLDFELVHFVTDTTLWISLGLLVIIFKGRNLWLWVAYAATCLHQVEHFYLFWLRVFHDNVYLSGGFDGVMGHNGLIGSPLDRPYLHYTYNFVVFVPMVIAIWDEARRMDRLHPSSRWSPPSRPRDRAPAS